MRNSQSPAPKSEKRDTGPRRRTFLYFQDRRNNGRQTANSVLTSHFVKQFSFTLDQGRKSHCVPIFKEGRRKANPELGLIENEEDMVSTNLLHFDSTFFITKLRRNFLINRYLVRMRCYSYCKGTQI